MSASLAEHGDEKVRTAVDDLGMIVEIIGCIDHAEHLDDVCDASEITAVFVMGDAVRVYRDTGNGSEWIGNFEEGELEQIPAPTRMQRWALQAVREDAAQMRRELAGAVLAEADGDVERYLADRGPALHRFTTFLRSLTREGDPDLAGLTLAVRQLRALAG